MPTNTSRATVEHGVRLLNSFNDTNGSIGGGGGGSGIVDDSELNVTHLVAVVKQKCEEEKQKLSELNDRFASYLNRVKFLENNKTKLIDSIEDVKTNWGHDCKMIHEDYEPKLQYARQQIDDITIEKGSIEIRDKRKKYEADDLKRQYEDELVQADLDKKKISFLEQMYAENLNELENVKKKLVNGDSDIKKYKKECERLKTELNHLLFELDKETLDRVKLETEIQTLLEQKPFLQQLHEHEMNELRLLSTTLTMDPTQFYQKELERAVNDIRKDYEELSVLSKQELEEWYRLKVDEHKKQVAKRDAIDASAHHTNIDEIPSMKNELNENTKELEIQKRKNSELEMIYAQQCDKMERFKLQKKYDNEIVDKYDKEINDLLVKLNDLNADYSDLMNLKASREFEINTYRRLLESEESRNGGQNSQRSSGASSNNGGPNMTQSIQSTVQHQNITKTPNPCNQMINKPKQQTQSHQTPNNTKENNFNNNHIINTNNPNSSYTKSTNNEKINTPSPIPLSNRSHQSNQGYDSYHHHNRLTNATNLYMTNNLTPQPQLYHHNHQNHQNQQQSHSNTNNTTNGNNLSPSVSSLASAYQNGTLHNVSNISPNEMPKTTIQRSVRGPIAITECDPDGRYIIIENSSSRKEIPLTNWVIKRQVDGLKVYVYKFPSNLTISPNTHIKIWSGINGQERLPFEIVNREISNWGIGRSLVVTHILNENDNEQATHIQKITYQI